MTDDPPTMTDDPSDNCPGHAEGDGPLPTTPSPTPQVQPLSGVRSSMSTVTPSPPVQVPNPPHGGGDPHSNEWVGLVKWLLSDHRHAAWAFAFVVVTLGAFVATAAFLAPYVGDLGGLLGGGLVGGGITFGAGALAQRRRRGQEADDQE
jgi:hypothetical protein